MQQSLVEIIHTNYLIHYVAVNWNEAQPVVDACRILTNWYQDIMLDNGGLQMASCMCFCIKLYLYSKENPKKNCCNRTCSFWFIYLPNRALPDHVAISS